LLQQLRAEERPTLGSLLAQNSVIGCTLALRPTVLDIALPFPRELCNHDWWLGLCVLAQGVLYVNREPLVRYRQHASNTVGAYRPLRQLPRLRALLERQRRVLRGQLLAVEALEKRLLARGLEPPAVLERYHRMLSGRYSSIRGLAFGPFAAPLLPLRALRTVAALTAQD
jgi:hypothetical protein